MGADAVALAYWTLDALWRGLVWSAGVIALGFVAWAAWRAMRG